MPDNNHAYTVRGECDKARWESLQLPANTTASDGPMAGWQCVVRQNWIRLSERVTLRAGDKVRVSGGPYWEQVDANGTVTRMRMGERGVMAFEEYCELGQSRWIVARGRDGYAALHIGPEEQSTTIPGLVRQPYRLRKVRESRRRPARAFPVAASVIKGTEHGHPSRRRGAA
jgi:hypothetical protein